MRHANLTTTSSLSLPPDSYIYKILPVHTYLAAISSDDSLRLIDPQTLRETTNGGVLKKVHQGVTCLQAVNHDPNIVLTAGRDAVVRLWDLRVRQKTMQLSDDSEAAFLSLASHGTNIAAGTELRDSQASVLIWDARSPSKPFQTYTESHNDDITDLSFHHPTTSSPPNLLLSGSADGLLNIYDFSIPDEDDALLQVENHGSAINHAGFLSSNPSVFYALSTDETFSLYRLNVGDEQGGGEDDATADESPRPIVFGDLRPKLDCEYVVDVIPSGGGGEAIIGAGTHSKHQLDLMPLRQLKNNIEGDDDWSFDPSSAIRLPGAHGDEIVRSIHVNNEDGTMFTAGEDGFVKAWRTSEDREGDEEEQGRMEADRPKKRKKKSSVADGGRSESGRFKPY